VLDKFRNVFGRKKRSRGPGGLENTAVTEAARRISRITEGAGNDKKIVEEAEQRQRKLQAAGVGNRGCVDEMDVGEAAGTAHRETLEGGSEYEGAGRPEEKGLQLVKEKTPRPGMPGQQAPISRKSLTACQGGVAQTPGAFSSPPGSRKQVVDKRQCRP
jgi:hypothetical protein